MAKCPTAYYAPQSGQFSTSNDAFLNLWPSTVQRLVKKICSLLTSNTTDKIRPIIHDTSGIDCITTAADKKTPKEQNTKNAHQQTVKVSSHETC